MVKKVLTLCIVHQDNKVLLGMKKRGFGEGKWNGFGGKVTDGESIEDAAKREVLEESGLTVATLEKMGVIDFSWAASAKASASQEKQILQVHIFKCKDFSGEQQESEEMKPQWFAIDKIPYETMWSSDGYWLPLFLQNKKFTGNFVFDEENKVAKYELKELD